MMFFRPLQIAFLLLAAMLLFGSPARPAGAQGAPPVNSGSAPGIPAEPAKGSPAEPAASTPIAPIETPMPSSVLPHELSPWGMFLGADIVVKAVMVGLAVASVVTWTVLFAKSMELAAAFRHQRQALAAVAGARSLGDAMQGAVERGSVAADLLDAAGAELRLSADALADREGLKERLASHLHRIEARAAREMTSATGILATIGATAPFVGLFGTVWGIMNSFIGISKAQTTNLAVVAPGIAEALLATALGLVAAIPAVVIYNHIARRIAAYRALLADTTAAVLRLASRDLSRGAGGPAMPRARDAAE